MTRFVVTHCIHPVVDKVYEFERWEEAYRRLASDRFFGTIGVKLL